MSTNIRRLLSLLMCIAMLITCFQTAVYAENEEAEAEHVHTASEDGYGIMAAAAADITIDFEGTEIHDSIYSCNKPTVKITALAGLQSVSVSRSTGESEDAKKFSKDSFEEEATEYSFKFTEEGYFTIEVKDKANKTNSRKILIGHLLGGRQTINYDATCTQPSKSVLYYICKYCGEHYYSYTTKVGEALGHDFNSEVDNVVPSPCENPNATGNQRYCKRCGEIENTGIDGIEFDGSKHKWTTEGAPEPKVAENKCTDYARKYEKCSECGAVRVSETVEPTGHTPDSATEPLTAATCTVPSYRNIYCKDCGNVIEVRYYGGALGHNMKFDDPTLESQGTCTNPPTGPATCTRCDHHEESYTPASKGHNYEIVTTVEPTCITTGLKKRICKVCGEVDPNYSQEIPTVDHIAEPDDLDCSTPVLCKTCHTVLKPAEEHTWGRYFSYNTNFDNHWRHCTKQFCNAVQTGKHEGLVSCKQSFVCTICQQTISARGYHNFKLVDLGNGNHIQECVDCKYRNRVSEKAHTATDDNDCTTPVICECGAEVKAAMPEHNLSGTPIRISDQEHEYDCENPNCTERIRQPHNYNHESRINEVAATCTIAGSYVLVKSCECGAAISENVTVEPTGHTLGELVIEDAPECEESGTSYRQCTVCGEKVYETVPGTGHDWEDNYTIDQDSTCTTEGTESIHCRKCNATKDQRAIPVKNHTFTEEKIELPATCTTSGMKVKVCSVCKAEGEAEEIPATGHTFGKWEHNGTADCEHGGTKTQTCTVCGYVTEPVPCEDHPPLGHNFEYVYNNDATIEVDGTETEVCTRCGAKGNTRTAEGTALPGHSFIEYIYNNDATCEKDGTETSTCSVCHVATDTREVPGTALGHSFTHYESDGNATCGVDGTKTAKCDHGCGKTDTQPDVGSALTHYYESYTYNGDATCMQDGTESAECVYCHMPDVRTAVGTKLEHRFVVYVSDGNTTCEDPGTETAECEYGCGTKNTRDSAEALGHIWESMFEWSEDNKTAKVVFTCMRDKSHKKEFETEITETVIPPTCEEDGIIIYAAIVEIDGIVYEDAKEVPGDTALGHKYGEPVVTWSEDNLSAEAEFVCERCGVHSDKIKAVVTKEVVHSATCKDPGLAVFTAIFSFEGKSYSVTKDVAEYNAEGHNWSEPRFTWNQSAHTATAKSVCLNDSTHAMTLEVSVSEDIYKQPTCTQEGRATYTASAELGGKIYTESIIINLPKVSHKYVNGVCEMCGEAEPNYQVPHTHIQESFYSRDGIGHWISCGICGSVLSYSQHSYADHVCTVCGFREYVPSDAVTVDVPQEIRITNETAETVTD